MREPVIWWCMVIVQVGEADVIAMLEARPTSVLIQGASVAAPALLWAVVLAQKHSASAGALLEPKRDYVIEGHPQRHAALCLACGSRVGCVGGGPTAVDFNPNLNALRGNKIVLNAASHAIYLVTNTGVSLVSTGSRSTAVFRQRNLCVSNEDRDCKLALTGLTQRRVRPAAVRRLHETVASHDLLACPGCGPQSS
jgi:hypothetical protein